MNKIMQEKMYTQGQYLQNNPNWHTEDSPWKASKILQIINKNNISPKTICEIGCGAGEILKQLQTYMKNDTKFWGYDISPQAFQLSKTRANERLNFKLADFKDEQEVFFDLILVIDLIEHLEDYFDFLKNIKSKGKNKVFHIPLDISVQTVLRGRPIMQLRNSVGHIHYFTKEIALESLKDSGYELIDYFYTASYVELPAKSMTNHIAKIPRQLFYALNQDLAVRTLGGYSLMVLAR
jgi:SAM-dependent methyltransferase